MLVLPSQQSCHIRKSIWGTSSQFPYPWGRSATVNTSRWTRVMLSPLSQTTRARDACLSCVSCAGVNTPGFSYQNLIKTQRHDVGHDENNEENSGHISVYLEMCAWYCFLTGLHLGHAWIALREDTWGWDPIYCQGPDLQPSGLGTSQCWEAYRIACHTEKAVSAKKTKQNWSHPHRIIRTFLCMSLKECWKSIQIHRKCILTHYKSLHLWMLLNWNIIIYYYAWLGLTIERLLRNY